MKTEIGKLRKMNNEERKWYIWEYYKVHIAILIATVILVGTIIHAWMNPRPAEYLYIAMDGINAENWQISQISTALAEITPENETVTVTNYTVTGNPAVDNALTSRFTALLFVGAMDIYITTRDGATMLAEQGYSRAVDEIRTYIAENNPQIHETMHERLFAAETADYMAISLEGSPLLTKAGIDTSDIYLCIFANTTRFYEISKAVEALLDGA